MIATDPRARRNWKRPAKAFIAEIALALRIRRPGPRVIVYHRVERQPDPSDPWSVSTRTFEEQMALIRVAGYEPIGLDELRTGSSRPGEQRSVLIAFDDGYRSALVNAVPVLNELQYPATFFLPAGKVGSASDWEDIVFQREIASWHEFRDLVGDRFDVGAHGHTHRDLTSLNDSELHHEVRESRRLIEERLGRRVDAFSVPFGREDHRLNDELLRAGYVIKITNHVARMTGPPLQTYPGVLVLQSDGEREFLRKLSGAYDWLTSYQRSRIGKRT